MIVVVSGLQKESVYSSDSIIFVFFSDDDLRLSKEEKEEKVNFKSDFFSAPKKLRKDWNRAQKS